MHLALITLLGFTLTSVFALPCPGMLPSQPPPVDVNKIRPGDVAAFAPLVLHKQSSEMSNVISRLQELLGLFNPAMISPLSSGRNLDANQPFPHGTLQKQAIEASLFLQSRQDTWKLAVIFVQVDQLCACEQQIQAEVRSVVSQVEEALQILHSQLKHTIVSLTLWDGEQDSFGKMCPCMQSNQGEAKLLRAMMIQSLQESLAELVERSWYNDRGDFAVVLQDEPVISLVTRGKHLSEQQLSFETDKLMVQLWMNLLQPTSGEPKTDAAETIISLPCPSEDRPFLKTRGNSPLYQQSNASPLLHSVMGTELSCEHLSPSPSTPVSVHKLRPGDIRVVAAVGDSLTAGNGIGSSPGNILDVLRQYRGLSWSIGGDKNLSDVTTLPNILKHFNPNVTGYSTGMGKQHTPQASLNQAVAGAKTMDIPLQVEALVSRMKNDPRINFESDWKVITVFIGGNDICDHCQNSLLYSVDNYVSNIRAALDYLHKEVPRALVNLVEPLHIVPLREMHMDSSMKCPTLLVKFLCPCVILPKQGSIALQKLEEINRGYQLALNKLVESSRYDTRSDFTVVIQPFFREIIVPRMPDGRLDRSYFSADCFHLSQKAQTVMARSLWNNMLENLGSKTSALDFAANNTLKCPNKTSPYIRTYLNSNYTYSKPSPTPKPEKNWGSDLACVDLAPSEVVPTSVHKLRPADIKVVAALGDSITAGAGAKAKNLFELSKEYKGVSWSIGGDGTLDTITTLPNILKKFNPSLKGFSRGQGSLQKGFNMAVPGAKASDIQTQIPALIKTMRGNKEVNFQEDWKLVTIFVGEHDLCYYCMDQKNLSPKNYSHNLMLSLDMLYEQVPRLLVNVVEIMQIDTLKAVKKNSLGCSLIRRMSCPCVVNAAENSPELEEIKRINHQYQTELEYLISGDRYEGRDDFAVVLQPFMHNYYIPHIGEGEADTSFFSMDCFQMSDRAHAEMAIALWNNMLEPVSRKQDYNNFTYDRSKIQCPSEAKPFIFTKINSIQILPVITTTTDIPTSEDSTQTSSSPISTVYTPLCAPTLPVWVPVVVGICSLLLGFALAWTILSCIQRQKNKKERPLEMKGGQTGIP